MATSPVITRSVRISHIGFDHIGFNYVRFNHIRFNHVRFNHVRFNHIRFRDAWCKVLHHLLKRWSKSAWQLGNRC